MYPKYPIAVSGVTRYALAAASEYIETEMLLAPQVKVAVISEPWRTRAREHRVPGGGGGIDALLDDMPEAP